MIFNVSKKFGEQLAFDFGAFYLVELEHVHECLVDDIRARDGLFADKLCNG